MGSIGKRREENFWDDGNFLYLDRGLDVWMLAFAKTDRTVH